MENVKYAYEQFYYDRYWPLIHPEFQFNIWPGDVGKIPDDLAQDGRWYRPTEVLLAENMMNPNFIPRDPDTHEELHDLQVDNMQMEWSFSSGPEPSTLEDAPAHLLEAYVNFDLQVNTVGTMRYVVHSRPLFYFLPADSTVAQPWTWTIWRVDDGANLNNPG